jgi:hypothetical protein
MLRYDSPQNLWETHSQSKAGYSLGIAPEGAYLLANSA